jgi:3-oxoacyl-[acyl-carrier protein] reductase
MIKKVILITGGTSGIGEEVSNIFSTLNDWCVVVGSTRIKSNYFDVDKNIYFTNLDVSCEESVKSCFDFISRKFGKLNALVNSAGYVDPLSVQETTIENWNKTISVNLTGTFLSCKYAIPLLKYNGSYIVNIASTAGTTARPGWAAYAASKSGVITFTQALVEEVSEYGIKCHIISPGRTATPLRKLLAPNENPTEIMQPLAVAKIVKLAIDGELDVIEGQDILVRQRF